MPRSCIRALPLAALAALAGATPASAETVPYAFSAPCGAFDILVQGQETITQRDFPGRVVIHDSFRETDTNSLTGLTLRFAGTRTEVFDLAAGTRTVTGRSFQMTRPGEGVVIHDAGRVVFDAPFHVVFEGGHHEVLHGNVDALACEAFA